MVEIIQGNGKREISCDKKQSILEFLRESGYEVSAVCSGNQTCGKCKVQILEECPIANEQEGRFFSSEEIEAGLRLSCAHPIRSGMKIRLADKVTYQSLSTFDLADSIKMKSEKGKGYGVAIDLGTTTVVIGLVSREKKAIVQVASFLNPQSSYGADVISRIEASKRDGGEVLQALILEEIKKKIKALCELEKIAGLDITDFVISGNTTMLYLLQGYDPQELALAPFVVSHSEYVEFEAKMFFAENWPGTVHLFPCISAYVGGDIVSGLYAYGKELEECQPVCLLDLGTNGEILLMDQNKVVCAATAAGPAFEGAGIQSGIGGISGAIDKVQFDGDRIAYSTIDEADPIGICGSGIIDVVSEGIRTGRIDKTGRMASGDLILCQEGNQIVFTQKDIREVQLAKAAIAAGIKVLASHMEISIGQIKSLHLAGGFGQYLNLQHAGTIGLIPNELVGRSKAIGNASFAGAYKALFDLNLKENLEEIQKKCAYIELSSEKTFNGIYIQEMGF
ncbi:hypothetical protein SANA_06760 [Gottschalkiaceae bacterium SANA]|nr:hypothetical protein SANA_06760 [Gottschalkiaceae bacterium SANA]